MKQGDLVIHNGKARPNSLGRLVGILIQKDKKYQDFYEVFWYTTGQIQSIHADCLDIYGDKHDT
tara:strand:- start:742 stop:933 length:192 start_codon:yes stop_codon:yes gene_type:complete